MRHPAVLVAYEQHWNVGSVRHWRVYCCHPYNICNTNTGCYYMCNADTWVQYVTADLCNPDSWEWDESVAAIQKCINVYLHIAHHARITTLNAHCPLKCI